MQQKAEKRRLFVRLDVEPLPADVLAWMPPKVREASELLDRALETREEAEIAFEIAESDARSAARSNEAAEDAAMLEGKPFPAVKNAPAVEALETARRAMYSADRVAASSIDRYLRALDECGGDVGQIIGARVAAENERARRALAEVEDAVIRVTQLDRLGGTLRDPRWTGSQPRSRTAWEQPMPDRHAGLEAVNELFNICGGREVLAAA